MGNIDDRLEDALALLAAGMPMSEILAEAGADAEWLRPLLEVANDVKALQPGIPVPSPEASLRRMLAYGQEMTAPTKTSWVIAILSFLKGGWVPRLATGLASALLLLVLVGGMLTVLAQRSLPGEPLYGLKRAAETLHLRLTSDPNRRAQLLENQNEQRQLEAKLLLEQNREGPFGFSGWVEAVRETQLTVDGLVVERTPQTQVRGSLAVGARVAVEGIAQPPGRLVAVTIAVIEPAPPMPTPQPTPTSTLTPTPLPSPTATATATRSLSSDTDKVILPTYTPTATFSQTPTRTPTLPPPPPTAMPSPSPLPLPTFPGNDNRNENDNSDGASSNNNGNDNSSNDNSGGGNSGSGSDNSGSGSSNSGSDSGNSGSGSD